MPMKQRPCRDCQKPSYGDYCRVHSNLRIGLAKRQATTRRWWRQPTRTVVVQTGGKESWWTQGGTREEFFKRQEQAYAERMRFASGRTTQINLVD